MRLLEYLRAIVRALQTERESVGTIEKIVRSILMVPPFAALLVLLHLRARVVGPLDVTIVSRTGTRVRCHPPDFIELYLWLFGIWEPDLTHYMSDHLAKGDGVVDVGANIGYFSAVAAERVGATGRIVAIEASPAVFEKLRDTVRLNQLSNVRCVNIAAAAKQGTTTVFCGPAHNTGLTTTVASRGMRPQASVATRPLDEILQAEETAAVGIVKIDVEGSEPAVIAGMKSFLARCRGDLQIVTELSPTWWQDPALRPIDVLKPLLDAGFHVYEMRNNYWPWRYLWPRSVSPVRRCTRDLTRRVARLDLVLSRRDGDAL